jgi:uncharacterized membrane protein YeaQ/YmgE (transglycosylase-associated protein family)
MSEHPSPETNSDWSTVYAAPTPSPAGPAPASRWREDLSALGGIVVASVLLGAPAGLLWSAVAPRLTVTVTKDGPQVDNIESTKAFIGADGSYLVVMLVVGALCGALAWRFARRSGPFTVLGLVIGGVLAALIAQRVGLLPGAREAVSALKEGSPFRGNVDLFLGARDVNSGAISLRAGWAAIGWPLGALLSFLLFASRRPDELD